MQVVEKTRRIDVTMTGDGLDFLANIIKSQVPDVSIIDDNEEFVDWDSTDIAKQIKASRTPGSTLRAYREREGLTLVRLAEQVNTKYTNISAMENDRRVIGVSMAKKLGKVLHVDFAKFLV